MKPTIVRAAAAGTLESSDCLVSVAPAESLELEYRGGNAELFRKRTGELVEDVFRSYGLEGGRVTVQDQGAILATLRARLETALERAFEEA